MKNERGREAGKCSKMVPSMTVAIDICLLFYLVVVLSLKVLSSEMYPAEIKLIW